MLECPHGCMHDQFCIKFPNHHCCMCVMEIMWDIPLSLNSWPNQRPDIYHVQPFYKPWAKISTHHKPWPRVRMNILALGRKQKKKIPNQRSEESKRRKFSIKIGRKQKKKEKFSIKDRKKTKYTERSLDQTISEQYKIVTSRQEKERKPRLEVVPSLWLPTKILCASDFLAPH